MKLDAEETYAAIAHKAFILYTQLGRALRGEIQVPTPADVSTHLQRMQELAFSLAPVAETQPKTETPPKPDEAEVKKKHKNPKDATVKAQ